MSKKTQSQYHGSSKFSRLCLTSKSKNSNVKNGKLSKYFKLTDDVEENLTFAQSRDLEVVPQKLLNFESPYKTAIKDVSTSATACFKEFDDESDFTTPELVSKFKKKTNEISVKPKRKTRVTRNKSKRNPFQKTIKESFQNLDVNPDHLSLALALSKSEYEADHGVEENETKEEFPSVIELQRKFHAKSTLEKFGFKSGRTKVNVENKRIVELNKRSKTSKYQYITPVLFLRTEEDRESLITSKISLTLSKNTSPEHTNEVKSNYEIVTKSLQQHKCEANKLFKISSLQNSSGELNFYTQFLNISPTQSKCGNLLRDWKEILGRDVSPPRTVLLDTASKEEKHQSFSTSFNNKECTKTAIDSRPISPDLFESDSEEHEVSPKQTLSQSSKLMCKDEKKINLNFDVVKNESGICHFENYGDNTLNIFGEFCNSPAPQRGNCSLSYDDYNGINRTNKILAHNESNRRRSKKLRKSKRREISISEEDLLDSYEVYAINESHNLIHKENTNSNDSSDKSLLSNHKQSDVTVKNIVVLNGSFENFIPTENTESDGCSDNVVVSKQNTKQTNVTINNEVLELTLTSSGEEILLQENSFDITENRVFEIEQKSVEAKKNCLANNKSTVLDLTSSDDELPTYKEMSLHERNFNITENCTTQITKNGLEVGESFFNDNKNSVLYLTASSSEDELPTFKEISPNENNFNIKYNCASEITKNCMETQKTRFINNKNTILDSTASFCGDENCKEISSKENDFNITENCTTYIKENILEAEETSCTTNEEDIHLSKYFKRNSFGYNSTNNLNVTEYVNDMLKENHSYNHLFHEEELHENNEIYEDLAVSNSQELLHLSDEELNYSSNFSVKFNCKKSAKQKLNYYNISEDEDEDVLNKETQVNLSTKSINYNNKYNNIDTEVLKILSSDNEEEILKSPCILNESPKILKHKRVEELLKTKISNNSELLNDSFDRVLENVDVNHSGSKQVQSIGSPEKEVTNNDATPNGKFIIKTSEITPMANYDEMTTPLILKELNKYGLKPMKRKRGTKLLKYIYEQTHPLVSDVEVFSSDEEEDIRVLKKRKHNGEMEVKEDISTHSLHMTEKFSKNMVGEIQLVGDIIPPNVAEEDLIFERRISSKISSCRLPLDIAWHNFVASNPEIKKNILLYEPLQLEVLHFMFKHLGFKFHVQDLLTFLDKKCITIRTAQHQSKGTKR